MRETALKKAIKKSIQNKKNITKAIKERIDQHMISEIEKMMDV
jgi:hypothetical protein